MEKKKNIIELSNRYRAKNYLEEVAENKYALRFGDDKEGDWCRVGLAAGTSWEDNEFTFVDPSGGPFMSVGGLIKDGLTIKRIYAEDNTYYIETEVEEDKNNKE